MAVGVCRQHHLGAASQRLAADLVGVADDELRPITGLAQDVGAAADADQDRLVLLDERLERLQVVSGAELLGDDQTCLRLMSTSMSGMPMPSISSGLSLRMNSIVLPANASR